jgi:hypothetical protein
LAQKAARDTGCFSVSLLEMARAFIPATRSLLQASKFTGGTMKRTYLCFGSALLAFAGLSLGPALGQSSTQNQQTPAQTQTQQASAQHGRSIAGEYGSGAGDAGKGGAKGVGAAAKGTGKGAADLATLHPVNAAGNVGKGAAVGAKDVGVGAAKGTGKVLKGTGKLLKKPF